MTSRVWIWNDIPERTLRQLTENERTKIRAQVVVASAAKCNILLKRRKGLLRFFGDEWPGAQQEFERAVVDFLDALTINNVFCSFNGEEAICYAINSILNGPLPLGDMRNAREYWQWLRANIWRERFGAFRCDPIVLAY